MACNGGFWGRVTRGSHVAGAASPNSPTEARTVRERLQKILARAGYGSRRQSETLISAGRVTVNGSVISQLGVRADPDHDSITVDGEAINLEATLVYLAMNKPAGFLTTATDPHHRRTVMGLLPPDLPPHVFPVGRLDRDTEGLLLLTNDGEFAHRLSHPRYELDKEYHALVDGIPNADDLALLRAGVDIGDHVTSPADADLAGAPFGHDTPPGQSWIRLVIHEGRKRQVRLMCAGIGHPVRRLIRTRIGRIELGKLALGTTRMLDPSEVEALRRLVQLT